MVFRYTDDNDKEKKACTIGIETNSAIRKGEQILVDYGSTFWRHTPELEDGDPPDVPPFPSCNLSYLFHL